MNAAGTCFVDVRMVIELQNKKRGRESFLLSTLFLLIISFWVVVDLCVCIRGRGGTQPPGNFYFHFQLPHSPRSKYVVPGVHIHKLFLIHDSELKHTHMHEILLLCHTHQDVVH